MPELLLYYKKWPRKSLKHNCAVHTVVFLWKLVAKVCHSLLTKGLHSTAFNKFHEQHNVFCIPEVLSRLYKWSIMVLLSSILVTQELLQTQMYIFSTLRIYSAIENPHHPSLPAAGKPPQLQENASNQCCNFKFSKYSRPRVSLKQSSPLFNMLDGWNS